MSYHQTNLGVTNSPFADNTGYIPEVGDDYDKFNYATRNGPSRQEWNQWCQDAAANTARIEASIRRRMGV